MKNLRILAAATLFALTSIAMLAGCGDLPGGSGDKEDGKVCERAEECGTGYACVEFDKVAKKGKCRVDCAKNNAADQSICDTKAAGKVCTKHPITDNAGNVTGNKYACSPKAGGPGQQGPECSATKACKDTTKVCDVAAGKCVKDCTTDNTVCKTGLQTCDTQTKLCQDVPLHSVVIIDESTGDVACGSKVKDKGSDIVAVEVVGSDDSTIAFAGVRDARNGAANGDVGTQATDNHYDQDQPDGNAPSVDSKNCILNSLGENKHKFSSMGCGGGLSLSVGNTKSFKMGDKIKVYEYDGNVCAKDPSTASANEDKYKVYVCAKETALLANVADDCILISGTEPLSGFSETTIE